MDKSSGAPLGRCGTSLHFVWDPVRVCVKLRLLKPGLRKVDNLVKANRDGANHFLVANWVLSKSQLWEEFCERDQAGEQKEGPWESRRPAAHA